MQFHLNHVESDPDHQSLICCGMVFVSAQTLEQHVATSAHHAPVEEEDEQVPAAPSVTSSGRPLETIICECGMSFLKEEHRQTHIANSQFHANQVQKLNSESPPIVCSCGMTFKRESHRQEHMETSTFHRPRKTLAKKPTGSVTCDCGRSFKSAESHKTHLQESGTHRAQRASQAVAQKQIQDVLDQQATDYLRVQQHLRLRILVSQIQQQIAEIQGQIIGAKATIVEAFSIDNVADMEMVLQKLANVELGSYRLPEQNLQSLPAVLQAVPTVDNSFALPVVPTGDNNFAPQNSENVSIECTCGKVFTTKTGHEEHLRASTFHYFNVQHTTARQELSEPVKCSCGVTFKSAGDHNQHMAMASVHIKDGTAKPSRSSYASQMKTISPESDAATAIVLCNCRRAFINEDYFQQHIKHAVFHQIQAEAGVEMRMSERGIADFRSACAGIPLHVCECGRVFMTRASSEHHLALAPYHNSKRPHHGFKRARTRTPKAVLEFDAESTSDSDSDDYDDTTSTADEVLDSSDPNIWGEKDTGESGRLNWSVCSASCGWCGLCWNIKQDAV